MSTPATSQTLQVGAQSVAVLFLFPVTLFTVTEQPPGQVVDSHQSGRKRGKKGRKNSLPIWENIFLLIPKSYIYFLYSKRSSEWLEDFYQCKKQEMQLKMIKTMEKLSSCDQNFQGWGILELVTQRLIVGTQYPGSFHLSPQPSLAFRVLSLIFPRRLRDQQASHLDNSRKRDQFSMCLFQRVKKMSLQSHPSRRLSLISFARIVSRVLLGKQALWREIISL